MTKAYLTLFVVAGLLLAQWATAGPDEDRQAMASYFQARFPDVPTQDFANGLYALDEVAREQWIEIEDFPPYEIAIEEGEDYFNTPFSNGKTYADCFENDVLK